MATTRAKTGNSKPRVFAHVEEVVAPKKSTKANTSKPRAKKVTTGRVEKKKPAPATKKAPPKKSAPKAAKAKVEGKLEKVKGEVEGKPGKKAAGTKKAATTKKATPKTKKA
ncbi:uncharacterized protein BDR25DRAFT_308892 [Lindgomyces ingoldianus]|uniref:Uncharacterized protein n=1 Tax=Lindgomyces ingoldianus TaxID=673940 RepID=A0ACB6RHW8_9PLEO|nr:uncharacterized protein BDR25DRAFT_308892 [Lindgomyces ingoldianus]KAF2478071.1 hypothetical protein BDR25DRAFT_308892 [Lindgomyces ingoldianus]